jgi:hypothetical protein
VFPRGEVYLNKSRLKLHGGADPGRKRKPQSQTPNGSPDHPKHQSKKKAQSTPSSQTSQKTDQSSARTAGKGSPKTAVQKGPKDKVNIACSIRTYSQPKSKPDKESPKRSESAKHRETIRSAKAGKTPPKRNRPIAGVSEAIIDDSQFSHTPRKHQRLKRP